ncbi:uncharacterized protein BX663DRAFT_559443 [Cokeromyces recurvatus]|uniref:uncharacterized protein n=1 Tax=Cokeromyces recurvatus TaxID=90255 RepID=UPI00221EC2F1|nr:uncharacterized protein BX663DRAFT_559443 [Cokeromyces recurvatus]KAI7905255.1 hypothetical protein BX663DRAFT_559443 [Cokeromyces recurvatus]
MLLNEQEKLNRIKDYIQKQESFIEFYNDDDDSCCRPMPESCIINDNNLSDISTSISELIKRKYHIIPMTHQNQLHSKINKQRPCYSNNEIKKKEDLQASSLLPQTKTNGFHLLNKFVSPNLEINRITMKSVKKNKHHSKIGLFNKGKSSANGKAVQDLVFSESEFLRPRPQVVYQEKKDSSRLSSPQQQENHSLKSISRFFHPSSVENKSKKNTSSPSSSQQVDDIQKLVTHLSKRERKSPSVIQLSDHTPSSYATVKPLLKESKSNDLHYQQQMPSYSPAKTPTHDILYFKPQATHLSNQLLLSSSDSYPLMSFINQPIIEDDSSIYMYFQDPRSYDPHEEAKSLNWKIAEEFKMSTHLNDTNLFPVINLLEESKVDLQNFWLTQSYKRKL